MDLLFKRYASPFLLVDEMITNKQLSKFVNNLVEKVERDEVYDVWLHRVFDKTFSKFYEECVSSNNQQKVDVDKAIKESNEVLNVIQPN